MTNRNNIHFLSIQQTILVALLLTLALAVGWFLAYREYTTPPTETITIQLPPGVVASDAVLVSDADSGGNYGRE